MSLNLGRFINISLISLKEMLLNHLKVLMVTTIYIGCHILIIFTINFHYSEILTYYFFNKLLAFNNLFAITFYEILLTKLYLTIIFTLLMCIPVIIIYIFLYIMAGLYMYEFKKFIAKFWNGLKIYLFELTLCLYFFLPFIIKYSNSSPENIKSKNAPIDATIEITEFKIIQIYSYANITSLVIKIILLWLIAAVIVFIYKNSTIKTHSHIQETKIILSSQFQAQTNSAQASVKTTRKRRIPRQYVPLLALIFGLLGPFGADIVLQCALTFGIFIYLEGHSLMKYWQENREFID
jgi:hypothetical protein